MSVYAEIALTGAAGYAGHVWGGRRWRRAYRELAQLLDRVQLDAPVDEDDQWHVECNDIGTVTVFYVVRGGKRVQVEKVGLDRSESLNPDRSYKKQMLIARQNAEEICEVRNGMRWTDG